MAEHETPDRGLVMARKKEGAPDQAPRKEIIFHAWPGLRFLTEGYGHDDDAEHEVIAVGDDAIREALRLKNPELLQHVGRWLADGAP